MKQGEREILQQFGLPSVDRRTLCTDLAGLMAESEHVAGYAIQPIFKASDGKYIAIVTDNPLNPSRILEAVVFDRRPDDESAKIVHAIGVGGGENQSPYAYNRILYRSYREGRFRDEVPVAFGNGVVTGKYAYPHYLPGDLGDSYRALVGYLTNPESLQHVGFMELGIRESRFHPVVEENVA